MNDIYPELSQNAKDIIDDAYFEEFNSVLSEMFFTFLALVLGIGNLIVSFKIIKNK